MVYIVSLGPGDLRYTLPIGLEIISKSEVLVGGRRLLETVENLSKENCQKIIFDSKTDLQKVLENFDNVTILASGDATFFGILKTVLKYVSNENVIVIPGISSVQYLASKLAINTDELITLSFHGKTPENLDVLKYFKSGAFLTDDKSAPQVVAQILKENGITYEKFYVGENLSYKNEQIYTFSHNELTKCTKKFELNVVIAVGRKDNFGNQ